MQFGEEKSENKKWILEAVREVLSCYACENAEQG